MNQSIQPSFCPRCQMSYDNGELTCSRCSLMLDAPEMPRLREISVQRRQLQTEWDALVRTWQLRLVDRPVVATARPSQADNLDTPKREWTTHRVQNVLLGLGASLCALAALIFIAVQWDNIGISGRGLVMVLLTIAAAATGEFVKTRGLRSTAETLTMLAYTLVLIDVASARALDLFGLQLVPGWQYWSLAFAAITAVAILHRRLSTQSTPRYVALLGSQLVVPVVTTAGWTSTNIDCLGLAVQSVATLWYGALRGRSNAAFVRVTRIAGAVVLVIASLYAIGALFSATTAADTALPFSLTAVALGLFAVAPDVDLRTRARQIIEYAVGLEVFVVVMTIVRHARPDQTSMLVSLVAGTVVVAALVIRQRSSVALAYIALATTMVSVLDSIEVFAHAVTLATAWTNNPWPDASSAWSAYQAHQPTDSWYEIGALASSAVVSYCSSRVASFRRAATAEGAGVAVAISLFALVPVFTIMPLALAVTWSTLISILSLVIGRFATDALPVRFPTTLRTAVVMGLIIGIQALCWALSSTSATLVVLMAAAVVAVAFGAADRKTLIIGGPVACAAGASWLVAFCSAYELFSIEGRWLLALCFVSVVAVAISATHRSETNATIVAAVVVGVISLAGTASAPPLLSVGLAVTTAGLAIHAIVRRRELSAWVAAVNLVALVWQQLTVGNVMTVEAYTLPAATVVLAFGVRVWLKEPERGSVGTLGWGLLVGLLPSLVQLSIGHTDVRALLVLVSALMLLAVGAVSHTKAPIMAGVVAVTIDVLVTQQPYIQAIPNWVIVGITGSALVIVGATWEKRRTDVRTLKARIDALK